MAYCAFMYKDKMRTRKKVPAATHSTTSRCAYRSFLISSGEVKKPLDFFNFGGARKMLDKYFFLYNTYISHDLTRYTLTIRVLSSVTSNLMFLCTSSYMK